MQVEKFYKAQELRKEILELQTAAESHNLSSLNLDFQKHINEKVAEVIKKELLKIIKQKEKEFNDL